MKRKRFKLNKKAARPLLIVAGLILLVGIGVWFFPKQEKGPVLNIYFLKGGKLSAVERALAPDRSPLKQAADALIAGPTREERSNGYSTMIPPGTRTIWIVEKNGVAIINLNRKLEAYGGGASRVEGLVAQIVYTLTDIPGIEKTWIWMAGEKEIVLGGEGLILDKPLSRRDLAY
ncbi:MAG: GerMN domain-containing protein [Candidatus Margulisbacteria bacterium]|nr:GerMN domain-containing protein [Candidatus Margulisiibacteriota bacterium]